MVSLITASCSTNFSVFHTPFTPLSPPRRFFPVVLVISSPKRRHFYRPRPREGKGRERNQLLFEGGGDCGVVRMCKGWEVDGETGLEMEVLKFMRLSKNPEKFPSRRELVEGGRGDLAEAIVRIGGWMSMGWEDDEDERERSGDGLSRDLEVVLEKCRKNGVQSEGRDEDVSYLGNSSPAASSSGRSLETETEEDGGIQGILNRLERQRNLSFGLNLGTNGSINHAPEGLDNQEHNHRMPKDVDSCRPGKSQPVSLGHDGPTFGINGLHPNGSTRSPMSNSWRSWSIERAGCSDTEFEAAEIDFGGNKSERIVDERPDEVITSIINMKKPLDMNLNRVGEITKSNVKVRLQHLEHELSTVLHSLRSSTAGLSEGAKEHLSEDLRQLSDESEFQENAIMSSHDKLRSIRAKLAVLEGKMALAIIDAQKVLDVKQKRIDDARRALQLLRTTCIVWPNSGSEVLLAGSFDGWATQRKMEKSSTGIFSLCLKLYPGKYEIKFIVDGSWKVDPLRPIVSNNGIENNLLIIT